MCIKRHCDEMRIYVNRARGRPSTVPRHTEINEYLARKICRDLGIPSLYGVPSCTT